MYGRKFAVDGTPDPAWSVDGKALDDTLESGPHQVLADRVGGYYITAVNAKLNLGFDTYLQHITAAGDPAPGWNLAAMPIATGLGDQDGPSMALDDSGGVFLVWEDLRAYQIRGVRLHADGTIAVAWALGGNQLSTPGSVAAYPSITRDGAGGFLATWVEQRPPATGSFASAFAFHFRADGTTALGWPALGVPLMQRNTVLQPPLIASDGAGGVFSVWADFRSAPHSAQPYLDTQYWDIYGQHVLANGTIAPGWPADAMPICIAGNTQWYPTLIPDGQGGMIAEWADYRNLKEDMYAVRFNGSGTRASGWVANGNVVMANTSANLSQVMASDGAGGMYAGINDETLSRCYVQHLLGDGSVDPSFGTGGRPVSDVTAAQGRVFITEDGLGGVYAVWEDNRGGTDPSNIWANHFGPDIATATLATLVTADATQGSVHLVWQGDGLTRASVERRDSLSTWSSLANIIADGTGRLAFDDRSVDGGVRYAYRLRYALGSSTVTTAESWVAVPARFELALAGLRPNPSSGDLSVSFTLPGAKPGRLELLDVTGRRIAERDLSSYPAGRYTEKLSQGARVPAGMYWIRLTHGGKALTTRGVVIR